MKSHHLFLKHVLKCFFPFQEPRGEAGSESIGGVVTALIKCRRNAK
jgi:hypothetical protein